MCHCILHCLTLPYCQYRFSNHFKRNGWPSPSIITLSQKLEYNSLKTFLNWSSSFSLYISRQLRSPIPPANFARQVCSPILLANSARHFARQFCSPIPVTKISLANFGCQIRSPFYSPPLLANFPRQRLAPSWLTSGPSLNNSTPPRLRIRRQAAPFRFERSSLGLFPRRLKTTTPP